MPKVRNARDQKRLSKRLSAAYRQTESQPVKSKRRLSEVLINDPTARSLDLTRYIVFARN